MDKTKICVIGLGYVGLPLAVAFGKLMPVIGFDVREERINQLKQGIDKTREVSPEELKKTNILFTTDPSKIKDANFIIIAVPTPIDNNKKPDLKYIESASKVVGQNLQRGTIVVYESTVYPGVTEEIALPILEQESKMRLGEFKIGYSPERINPGDKEHTIDKVVKIVSGCDEETLEKIAKVYALVVKAGVFRAKNIKTAEAAKVIENIQRDLNIALMNELSLIFQKMGLVISDVLDAAGTKWNFHKYHPGLVGGHCIGVDPYYLTYKAQKLGYNPKVILAGREINDHIAKHVAESVIYELKKKGNTLTECSVLIMGLTFKENVPDIRNSKAKDIIHFLGEKKIHIIGCDPLLEKELVAQAFGIDNVMFDDIKKVNVIILINNHTSFSKITSEQLHNKCDFLFDVQKMMIQRKEENDKK